MSEEKFYYCHKFVEIDFENISNGSLRIDIAHKEDKYGNTVKIPGDIRVMLSFADKRGDQFLEQFSEMEDAEEYCKSVVEEFSREIQKHRKSDGPFLVFAGGYYYPGGGMKDFCGAFDKYEQAVEYVAKHEDHDWADIVRQGFTEILFQKR